MIKFIRTKAASKVARFLLANILINLGYTFNAHALTSGPSQPEFSTFEPVSTNQMVDEFSGDFTYNLPVVTVPGPQGSEYPLSLSYHSGSSPEDEASWVGYGWTLNPGAINRNTRGFPDDFNNARVNYWNKKPKNWTVSVGAGLGTEAFGIDLPVNRYSSVRYNNNQGFGSSAGAGISLGKGIISLGLDNTDGSHSFSLSINPAAILRQSNAFQQKACAAEEKKYLTHDKSTLTAQGVRRLANNNKRFAKEGRLGSVSIIGGNYGFCSYSEMNRSTHVSGYNGAAVNVSVGLQGDVLFVPVGGTGNLFGSYSWQKDQERDRISAFGYMYSGASDVGPSNQMQDYYTEKETPYNKRDLFLGMPFHNADMFSVSGEGMGGGFRLYHKTIGDFAPNTKESKIEIANASPEIAVGLAFGPGSDLGAGWQDMTEGPWQSTRPQFSTPDTEDEGVFFRFINDLGGDWSSPNQSDRAVRVALDPADGFLGSGGTAIANERQHAARSGRSSYIAYRTKEQLYSETSSAAGLSLLHSLSRRSDLAGDMYLGNTALSSSAICEMGVTAATGSQYIYGLPVFAANERNISYGVGGLVVDADRYIVNSPRTDAQEETMIGEDRGSPYASSFVLTDIYSPDYVDRSLNGSTPDDFGGYTLFQYNKLCSLQGSPYRWRVPYTGLLYQQNSLSDSQDDLGSFSSGEKEIAYLHTVQTKTHTAFFILGTSRADGLEAPLNSDAKKGQQGTTTRKSLNYLQSIEVYKNTDLALLPGQKAVRPLNKVPIKTVLFTYTNEMCSGLPNAAGNVGKLTLKSVQFLYNGIVKEKPYQFKYQYPDFASTYPAKYITGPENVALSNTLVQNPTYSTHLLDAWGNYQYDGGTRYRNLRNWLNQGPDNAAFDPAAWQLKQIILPTGGEIHIQYEQDDYNYVQDKRAHAMVSVTPVLPNVSGAAAFLLNTTEILGAIPTDITSGAYNNYVKRRNNIIKLIEEDYIRNGNKLYFKFLYNLYGTSQAEINGCNSEYINGYIKVKQVSLDGDNIRLEVGEGANGLPAQVCDDFLHTQRMGKLNASGICDPTVNGINDDEDDYETLIRYILARSASFLTPGLFTCRGLNQNLSYFRIPLSTPKKGGGIRVKRLLTFDQDPDEPTRKVLYGNEYIYTMPDPADPSTEISSGVATTEPLAIREENVLVQPLARTSQGLISRIVAGKDLKQVEGPLGESMLPAPSVGYSRVVVRNIHSGISAPGYSVSEFATVRQYPMLVENTPIFSVPNFLFLYGLWATEMQNDLRSSQGYSFILNNMHGQVQRRATYAGRYIAGSAVPSKVITEQKYIYYQPPRRNETAAITTPESVAASAGRGQTSTAVFPGREVDMTFAQHSVQEHMTDLNFEFDTDIAMVFGFPVFFASVMPTVTHTQAEFYTHVTTKVVRYPAIVKSVEETQDGITHVTTNLVFDQFTGEPVLTKANDEFDKGYLQETIMASWLHPEFRPKAEKETKRLNAGGGPGSIGGGIMQIVNTDNKTWLRFTGATCNGISNISRGDLLQLNNDKDYLCYADAPDLVNKRVRLYPVEAPVLASNVPVPTILGGIVLSVTIVGSGRSNELATVAGTTTYHLGTNFGDITASSLPVYSADPAACTGNDDFLTAIQGAFTSSSGLAQLTVAPQTLSGPYPCINVSAYANKLQQCSNCVANPARATVKDIELRKQIVDGQLRLTVVSFKVVCENGAPDCTIVN